MKRQAPATPASKSSEPPGTTPGGSIRRRWGFRIAAVMAFPVLLVVTELALRVAGYGYDTRFFQDVIRDGKRSVVPNPRFAQRFFPPGLARSPSSWVMDPAKPQGTFRIFLFGESAAMGDPRPAFGMGRYLRALLQERHPGARFEVIPMAMTAINSHALRDMAREASRYDGDLWVIYMGNNEMAGPFGAISMFGARAPSQAWIRALLALKTTRVGQALGNLADSLKDPSAKPASWRGMGMFSGQSLAPGDPARGRVQENFRSNLRAMVGAGAELKIPVLVCTVASNLRDCGPFGSAHNPALGQEAKEQWQRLVAAGLTNQTSSRWADSLAKYDEASHLDKQPAVLEYLKGRVNQALTNQTAALQHLIAARDLDALPFRTDSALNRIAGEVAAEYRDRGVVLVDVEKALATAEVPGQAQFLDHVHLTFDGNYRVARELASAVESRLPQKIRGEAAEDWAAQDTIEQRLALTDWNRYGAFESMYQRCQDAPFTNQVNHGEHIVALRGRMNELRERLHPRLYVEAGDIYREAIAKSPGDSLLYESQAEFLEATQQPAEALAAWQKVVGLVPNHPAGWYNVGRLLGQQGRFGDARFAFEKCLAQRPGELEVLMELGRIMTLQTNYAESIAMFDKLRVRFPDDPRILRYLADPLAASGRRGEAVECLQKAVQLRPGFWEARYLLGVELAVDGKVLEAAREFESVLRVRPDHTLSRLNFGVALVRLGQVEPARRQFNEVLRQDPQNARARQHLDTLEQMLQKMTNAPPRR